ncbi:MAG: dipeptide epimerase [Chloroflexota bacterium]|nr:dipeptide epimerase [Chloroflexota bacterium]
MNVATQVLQLALRDPFRIARHEPDQVATTVITEIDLAGLHGLGEAYPVAYYGETAGTVRAIAPLLAEAIVGLGDPPANVPDARAWLLRASQAMAAVVGRHGAAKAGMDIALHDLVARGLSLPLTELLGTSADIPPTDLSIGLDEPATVAMRAQRAGHFPALKIKLGGTQDLATLEQVRSVYAGPIRVDANTGWEPEAALRLLPELVRLGVELIEQPFPAHALPRMRWLQERSPLPIVADESCETETGLESLVGVVAGVNVKLMKCGGVGPALRMMRRARELGFKLMLGCMEETSVGIAAGAALASLADWVDLDGNLLLASEPFGGLELDDDCRWVIGRAPGLGVERVEKSVDKLVEEGPSARR